LAEKSPPKGATMKLDWPTAFRVAAALQFVTQGFYVLFHDNITFASIAETFKGKQLVKRNKSRAWKLFLIFPNSLPALDT